MEAVALLPAGLGALVAACAGRPWTARRALCAEPEPRALPLQAPEPEAPERKAGEPQEPPEEPAPTVAWRLAGHALLTVLLGALAWVLSGVLVLSVVRGLFYGFVDHGPYGDSWGGPSRTGAWLAHFAAGTPFAFAATALLYGVAELHRRTTAPLRGERRPWWALPTVLASGVAGVLFVIAFIRQLG
ncbi:hypothetical protein [Streptomyces marispadix]|uniref:Integral membrane protein n=1 Tax=Streptomyces marispadix TaxID=2922868 RepID=A0ABS9SXH0_9ACTN|nr:hypothetical protein [Streptomyces marispadix]MCH6160979.1 hypothetical protein [Streptomyces marispadix]